MRDPTDPDWVYGYNAWTAPLAEANLAAAASCAATN
jgi:salicylate hydroxylase/6-hydroxynicotinate 3-monooxygenase